MPVWYHFWEQDERLGGWLEAKIELCGWVQQMDEWVFAVTWLLITYSYFCPSAALLFFYLCQAEKIQVGCLSTCVFVTVPKSWILQLQGCYYNCTLTSPKDVIKVEVMILFKKDSVILTSCASSHLSLFSSINRLLIDCTKFWKQRENVSRHVTLLALHSNVRPKDNAGNIMYFSSCYMKRPTATMKCIPLRSIVFVSKAWYCIASSTVL